MILLIISLWNEPAGRSLDCSSNAVSGHSSVIMFNLEATLQQQLINKPYLSQNFNKSGKLTIEEYVHMVTRWTIRHGLMPLWFKDLMNVTKKLQFIDPTFRHSCLVPSSGVI